MQQLSPILPFIQYLQFEKRYSQHTIIAYQEDLQQFFLFLEKTFGETALAEIKTTFIRTWLASLKDQQLTAKSINRKISTIKSFFKFHLRLGHIQQNPASTLTAPKISKRLPVFVEQKDIKTLFNHVEFPDDWAGKTERLVLQLLYETGMRRSELINLKENNVDVANAGIKILGKGNKERILPCNAALINLLKEYSQAKKNQFQYFDKDILLVNEKGKKLQPGWVYKAVNKYLSLVTTVDRKSPHILRHTFATHLTNAGAELNAVKELLGHSSLAATQIYTHNTIEKLKDAYKKAHPKA
jgi:integrase/recombinase XerC